MSLIADYRASTVNKALHGLTFNRVIGVPLRYGIYKPPIMLSWTWLRDCTTVDSAAGLLCKHRNGTWQPASNRTAIRLASDVITTSATDRCRSKSVITVPWSTFHARTVSSRDPIYCHNNNCNKIPQMIFKHRTDRCEITTSIRIINVAFLLLLWNKCRVYIDLQQY